MRQYRNRFYSNADHTKRIRKRRDVTKSDACDQKTHRTHACACSLILTTAVSSIARAQKMDTHTVALAHHTTGVGTCPTLRGANTFPELLTFFYMLGVYTVSD